MAKTLILAIMLFTSVHGIRVVRRSDEESDLSASCKGDSSDYDSKDDLLRERTGWGEDTEGGKDGDIFVVDTTDDDGDCSLREALESKDKLWIVFHKKIKGKTIKLKKPIFVQSYKTIAGRGSEMTIRAPPGRKSSCDADTAFKINDQEHIIFADLVLDGNTNDWDKDNECADGVYMEDSKYLWFHHNTFTHWPDSAIEVRIKGSTLNNYISITENHVKEVFQAFVISADKLTFGRNYCDKVRRRCPLTFAGKTHSYNNVISDWKDIAIQYTEEDGQLFSQQNVFDPGSYKDVGKIKGKIEQDGNHVMGSGSNSKLKSDIKRDVGTVSSSFRKDSQKKVSVTKCSDGDSSCVKKLWEDVRDNAGPRD